MEPFTVKEKNAIQLVNTFTLDKNINRMTEYDDKMLGRVAIIGTILTFIVYLSIVMVFHTGLLGVTSNWFDVWMGILFGEYMTKIYNKFPYIKKEHSESKSHNIALMYLLQKHIITLSVIPITPVLYLLFTNGMFLYLGLLSLFVLGNLITSYLAKGYAKDSMLWVTDQAQKGRFNEENNEE